MATEKLGSLTAIYLLRRHVAELKTQVEAKEGAIESLTASITGLQAEVQALHASIHMMRTSFSWRISSPVRILGRLARTLLRPALRRYSAATETAVVNALPSPPLDPNERYIYRPPPVSADQMKVLTIDTLYHLSRSL